MIELHTIARAYGCRPSDLVGGLSEVGALTLDHHALMVGTREEQREAERAQRRLRR